MNFMNEALKLAKRGTPSPNPYVGCVIVKDNKIIGKGYHKKSGTDHAEIMAIKDAKKNNHDIYGSDLYVTLEPCCHHGKTPPCTRAIIKEKFSTIHIASLDPNPLVSGNGIQELRNAGITVNFNIIEKATELNEIFNKYITTQIPFTLLKSALSLDGKITYGNGKNKKITDSFNYTHNLRSRYDAILVGINTIIKDNPRLDCRLEDKPTPTKIILDTNLRTPEDSNVFKSKGKTLILTTKKTNKQNQITLPNLKPQTVLKKLGEIGITSVMIEGGKKINNSFLEANCIDKISLIYSPQIIGGNHLFFSGNEILKRIKKPKVQMLETDFVLTGYL